MNLPPPKACQRILHLFRMLGSPNANEANIAREQLNTLLAKHGLTWNDLTAIITAITPAASTNYPAPPQPPTSAPPKTNVNVLDLLLRLIELHVGVTPAERMAVALWILHCWVFDRYPITPRLVLCSPVRGCGKTTLLVVIELLTAEPYRVDEITAATIYHQLRHRPRTILLIDEGDNLGLLQNRVLRAVFNSGHRRGGSVGRFIGGWSQRLSTYAPLAVAAIGMLPLPLMHRAAAVINMQRHAPGEAEIQRPDETDPCFPAAREQIRRWTAGCSLARDPDMPPSLRNRAADNWRVLFAIADDLGHGEEARSAAIELCANRPDEDLAVVLLGDIQTVFLARGTDRVASAALVEGLLKLDDGLWHDWRGPRDDRPPHKLTQSELAAMLRPFGIRSRTIWPMHRQPSDKSARGYMRADFEAAWRTYCTTADTATQPKKIIQLQRF